MERDLARLNRDFENGKTLLYFKTRTEKGHSRPMSMTHEQVRNRIYMGFVADAEMRIERYRSEIRKLEGK